MKIYGFPGKHLKKAFNALYKVVTSEGIGIRILAEG